MHIYVCVCVCVCARAYARAHAYSCVFVCGSFYCSLSERKFLRSVPSCGLDDLDYSFDLHFPSLFPCLWRTIQVYQI